MIVISGALVLVALVLLVIGLVGQGLAFVYASIAVSLAAFVFLLLGILQRRGEPGAAPAVGAGAGAQRIPLVDDGEGVTVVPAAAPVAPPPPSEVSLVKAPTDAAPPQRGSEPVAQEEQEPPVEDDGELLADVDESELDEIDTTVLVVPGRPRYHVDGCRYLYGKDVEEVHVLDAREEGFTPCGVCKPDAVLVADLEGLPVAPAVAAAPLVGPDVPARPGATSAAARQPVGQPEAEDDRIDVEDGDVLEEQPLDAVAGGVDDEERLADERMSDDLDGQEPADAVPAPAGGDDVQPDTDTDAETHSDEDRDQVQPTAVSRARAVASRVAGVAASTAVAAAARAVASTSAQPETAPQQETAPQPVSATGAQPGQDRDASVDEDASVDQDAVVDEEASVDEDAPVDPVVPVAPVPAPVKASSRASAKAPVKSPVKVPAKAAAKTPARAAAKAPAKAPSRAAAPAPSRRGSAAAAKAPTTRPASPAPAAAAAAAPASRGKVVVIPDRGRFHRAECRYVRDVPGTKELSRAAASRQGYAACGVCRP